MLGYLTARQARAEGFTHHGSYYGIPCWIGDPEGGCMVAAKWAPLEIMMSVWHHVEGVCHMVRGSEPTFMFKVWGEIE